MATPTPQQRLRDWLYRNRMSRAALARATGAQNASLCRWLNQHASRPQQGFSDNVARALAERTGLPLRIFADGRRAA